MPTQSPARTSSTDSSSTRQIGGAGTAARAVVGVGLLTGAVVIGVSRLDALVGVVAIPMVVTLALATRRPSAPPLRATGPGGHCLNCVSATALFVLLPVGAMLFYGASMLLASVAGNAGCELTVVSNVLRRRDDRVGCPLFTPIDALDAHKRSQAF
jgi:hypothetical protein